MIAYGLTVVDNKKQDFLDMVLFRTKDDVIEYLSTNFGSGCGEEWNKVRDMVVRESKFKYELNSGMCFIFETLNLP